MNYKLVCRNAISNRAFSLVELSIVLIIIGLLVAGVTSGSKLIYQSKLQKFASNLNDMQVAVATFRVTYSQFPGDFDDAANIWSGQTSGDGNGKIDSAERPDAWDQLNVSGIYFISGTAQARPTLVFPEINKRFIYVEPGYAGFVDDAKDNNTIQIGKGSSTDAPAFIPKDMYFIDQKLDDGLPKEGKISFRVSVGGGTSDAGCTNSSTSYYLSSTAEACNMVYVIEL